MADKAVHIVVHGRVQGVGYRAFVEREAILADIAGWVRNRRNGTVEAVLSGDADAVDEVLAACRQGPPGARVSEIETSSASVVGGEFEVLPTE